MQGRPNKPAAGTPAQGGKLKPTQPQKKTGCCWLFMNIHSLLNYVFIIFLLRFRVLCIETVWFAKFLLVMTAFYSKFNIIILFHGNDSSKQIYKFYQLSFIFVSFWSHSHYTTLYFLFTALNLLFLSCCSCSFFILVFGFVNCSVKSKPCTTTHHNHS